MQIPKEKSLKYLTILYGLGNISNKVITIGIIFFLTYYLPIDQIGEYDLIFTTINIVFPVFSLQLADAVFRWILTGESEESNFSIISTGLVILNASFLASSIVSFFINEIINTPNLGFILVISYLMALFLYFQNVLRALDYKKVFIASGLLNSLLTLVFTFLGLSLFHFSLLEVLLSHAVSFFISCAFLIYFMMRSIHLKGRFFIPTIAVNMLNYSLPLIPNVIGWWSILSISRYFIKAEIGLEASGIFAVSNRIVAVVFVFTQIFQQSWQEKAILESKSQERDKYFSSVFKVFLIIIFGISTFLVLNNNLIFNYLFDNQYFSGRNYTPIITLGVIFVSISSFYGAGYLSIKKTKDIFISTLLGFIVTLIINISFVKEFGLYAASISIFLGFLTVAFYRVFHSKKHFIIIFPWPLFALLLAFFVLIALLGRINTWEVYVISLGIYVLTFVYLLKKNL